MSTHYARSGKLAHVTVGDTYRGAVLISKPGFCASCEQRSQWPLCPDCHDAVLNVTTPASNEMKSRGRRPR